MCLENVWNILQMKNLHVFFVVFLLSCAFSCFLNACKFLQVKNLHMFPRARTRI